MGCPSLHGEIRDNSHSPASQLCRAPEPVVGVEATRRGWSAQNWFGTALPRSVHHKDAVQQLQRASYEPERLRCVESNGKVTTTNIVNGNLLH